MKIGRMNRRIVIEAPTETRSSSGGVSRTWATYATRWAEQLPLRGREFYAAQAVNAETDVKFRMRYVDGLLPTMRIKVDGVVHDIRAILDLEGAGRTHEVMAKAGINQG